MGRGGRERVASDPSHTPLSQRTHVPAGCRRGGGGAVECEARPFRPLVAERAQVQLVARVERGRVAEPQRLGIRPPSPAAEEQQQQEKRWQRRLRRLRRWWWSSSLWSSRGKSPERARGRHTRGTRRAGYRRRLGLGAEVEHAHTGLGGLGHDAMKRSNAVSTLAPHLIVARR